MSQSRKTASLTAVLFCYRQADVVEDAIRSIFGQTVQPAEIILSDDASPDDSYQRICRMAEHYDGPAKIITRQTQGAAGWFAHINACMALASHDQVLVFAGDDVSRPNRVERFAETLEKHPQARLTWSLMERMTPRGKPTGTIMGTSGFIPGRLRGGVGASQCWHKDLITRFGELPPVHAAEDIILPFRASLLNGLVHIPEPLVLWRDRDYRELTREQLERTYEIRATQFRINASRVAKGDLETILKRHPERVRELNEIGKRLSRESRSVAAEFDVVNTPTPLGRFLKCVAGLRVLGFKRFRRLWQDQVLGLPAYLDSAYPRIVRKSLPALAALATAIFWIMTSRMTLPLRLGVAVVLVLPVMEAVRMGMRWLAKLRWNPR